MPKWDAAEFPTTPVTSALPLLVSGKDATHLCRSIKMLAFMPVVWVEDGRLLTK